jgi:hypothetical protein
MPATATIEQVTSEPLTSDASSTVIYDSLNLTISVTVVVSQSPFQPDPDVVVAPFTIPKGSWAVRWNLIAGSGVVSAVFPTDQDGISVPSDQQPPIPRNVTFGASQRMSDTEWQLQITNAVTTVNSFKYFIIAALTGGSDRVPGRIIVHDPTIAVTQDPIT